MKCVFTEVSMYSDIHCMSGWQQILTGEHIVRSVIVGSAWKCSEHMWNKL